MIIVTQEQIDEAKLWERKLAENGCSLDAALYMCMASGAPMPQYVIDRYRAAIEDYSEGRCKDLAEPFGIQQSQREKQAMATWDLQRKVHAEVELFGERGFAKTNPSHYDNTAFHKVAEAFNKSPSHIYDLYREACKQLR